MTKNEFKKKVKKIVKKSWKKTLVFGGVTVGLLLLKKRIGYLLSKMPEGIEVDNEASIFGDIDEAIFTDLAPRMEEAIFNKGLEKTIIEESYELENNLSKFITISIENVYGD